MTTPTGNSTLPIRILFLHHEDAPAHLLAALAPHFSMQAVAEHQVVPGFSCEVPPDAVIAACLSSASRALSLLRAGSAFRDTPVIVIAGEGHADAHAYIDADDIFPASASPHEMVGRIQAVINCARFRLRRHTRDVQELNEVRERLEGASAAGEVATWVWDIGRNRLFGDSNLANIFGFEETPAAPPPIEFYTAAIHIEDRERVVQTLRNCIRSGISRYEVDHRIIRPNGEIRSLAVRARIERDAAGWALRVAGAALDVTERVKAEQALKESEERLQQGLMAARMAVWEWDIASGRMNFLANAQSVFGGTWESAEAGWRYIHPDDRERLQREVEAAVAARSEYRTEVRMIRPDNGETIWIEAHGRIVCDASGTPRSVRGLSLDITKRKRAEEELLAADQRKDEFLAMLAHELRNPLAPIGTAAELLNLSHADESIVRKTGDIITRQVGHITRLMDDLLDVSRVTRGLAAIEKVNVDLRNIISDAVDQARPQIHAKRHQLSLQIMDEPACVQGDSTRLTQIVANLLNNAAKYTPNGGEIMLRLEGSANHVTLSVADNGIGITPDLLPHVFELFTQGKRSPDRSQGGLGLGLALVKSLVELHGGTVTARSAGNRQGSEFRVSLPRVHSLALLPNDNAPEETMHEHPSGLRILIVDDNVDAAQSLAMLMKTWGHEPHVAFNGLSAMEHAKSARPQILLLDIGLPDIDGYMLARRLRELPDTTDAMYIALTGYAQPQDIARSREAGFDHHVIKPADPKRLMEIISGAGTTIQVASSPRTSA